jgi:hypothetical protein
MGSPSSPPEFDLERAEPYDTNILASAQGSLYGFKQGVDDLVRALLAQEGAIQFGEKK